MRRRSLLRAAACVSAALFLTPLVWGTNGRCLRAEVPLPMIFPDGSDHPAGTLTLCVSDYSPVAAYHKVSMNGLPFGFMFSQRRVPERQQVSDPVVLFRKTAAGSLRLVGFLWPTEKKVVSYLLQNEPWDAKAQTRITATETAFPPPSGEREGPEPRR